MWGVEMRYEYLDLEPVDLVALDRLITKILNAVYIYDSRLELISAHRERASRYLKDTLAVLTAIADDHKEMAQ